MTNEQEYDSIQDTLDHIGRVRIFIQEIVRRLVERGDTHDPSKTRLPEKRMLDEFVPAIRKVEKEFGYGSPEYINVMNLNKEYLAQHFAANRHHPQHFEGGIDNMTLIDVVEMFCDWKAASIRGGGKFQLGANVQRFQVSDQLASIFFNTAKELGWIEDERA